MATELLQNQGSKEEEEEEKEEVEERTRYSKSIKFGGRGELGEGVVVVRGFEDRHINETEASSTRRSSSSSAAAAAAQVVQQVVVDPSSSFDTTEEKRIASSIFRRRLPQHQYNMPLFTTSTSSSTSYKNMQPAIRRNANRTTNSSGSNILGRATGGRGGGGGRNILLIVLLGAMMLMSTGHLHRMYRALYAPHESSPHLAKRNNPNNNNNPDNNNNNNHHNRGVMELSSSSSPDFSWDSSSRHPFYGPSEDPNPDAPWPRIAWLMSFPNSGTSYTMRLVGRISNLSMATNYGRECVVGNTNLPLYPHLGPVQSMNGPFLLKQDKSIPKKYIMTKTHCGGRCSDCGPRLYIETEPSFRGMCTQGGLVFSSPNNPNDFKNVRYSQSLVARAIHLIRNPFDNLVSRFHLEQNEHLKKNKTSWLNTYSNDITGFQHWCQTLDKQYHQEETQSDWSRFLDPSILKLFTNNNNLPCHGDFFRYAQWHNLARHTIQVMKLPNLILYYEDYNNNDDDDQDTTTTINHILNFLQLEQPEETKTTMIQENQNQNKFEFHSGKTYEKEYFTKEQRLNAIKLIRTIADPETWNLLQRYF